MGPFPAVAALVAACALAQPQPPAACPKQRPEAIQAIADAASGAPAELGSHLLLRMVEANLVKDREWRAELLDRAFRLAAGAKHPFRIAGAVGMAQSTDSDVGVLTSALEPGLDQLSLRCRAVRLMLAADPKAARDLFAEIPRPNPPALTCKESFAYRLGTYYSTAGALFDSGFDPRDRAEGRHLAFLEDLIRGIRSPFELEGAVSLLIEAKLSPDELARFLAGYSAVLRELGGDPRTLSCAVNYGLLQRFDEFTARCQREGVGIFPFAEAYRALMVRYASGTLCREQADPKRWTSLVEVFNSDLRKAAGPTGEALAPITEEEMRPAKIESEGECYKYWEKPRTRELLAELRRLRFGLNEEQRKKVSARPLTKDHMRPYLNQAERSTPEWEAEVREFLNKLENWKKDHDERDLDFFHQVEITYFALTDLVPPGPLLDRVLESCFGHLAHSTVKTEDPPQWFLHVDRKLRRKQNRDRIKAEALRSGDAVIAAYVALYDLIPPGAPKP